MCRTCSLLLVAFSLVGLLSASARADDLAIDWCTVDGGGAMWATGGTLELSGTIGQPDAGVTMTGGTLELTGGFWALPPRPPVFRGDLNCDGSVDFDDIKPFVVALQNEADYYERFPGCNWLNADCNCDGAVDFDDIKPFVRCIQGNCPC